MPELPRGQPSDWHSLAEARTEPMLDWDSSALQQPQLQQLARMRRPTRSNGTARLPIQVLTSRGLPWSGDWMSNMPRKNDGKMEQFLRRVESVRVALQETLEETGVAHSRLPEFVWQSAVTMHDLTELDDIIAALGQIPGMKRRFVEKIVSLTVPGPFHAPELAALQGRVLRGQPTTPEWGWTARYKADREAFYRSAAGIDVWERERLRPVRDDPLNEFARALTLRDESAIAFCLASKDPQAGTQQFTAIYIDPDFHSLGLSEMLMTQLKDWFDPCEPVGPFYTTPWQYSLAFHESYGAKVLPGGEWIEVPNNRLWQVKIILESVPRRFFETGGLVSVGDIARLKREYALNPSKVEAAIERDTDAMLRDATATGGIRHKQASAARLSQLRRALMLLLIS